MRRRQLVSVSRCQKASCSRFSLQEASLSVSVLIGLPAREKPRRSHVLIVISRIWRVVWREICTGTGPVSFSCSPIDRGAVRHSLQAPAPSLRTRYGEPIRQMRELPQCVQLELVIRRLVRALWARRRDEVVVQLEGKALYIRVIKDRLTAPNHMLQCYPSFCRGDQSLAEFSIELQLFFLRINNWRISSTSLLS